MLFFSRLKNSNARIRLLGVCGFLLFIAPQLSWAAHTPAGTIISSTVTVDYTRNGVAQTPITTTPVSLTVDELIQPTLTWQDGTPIAVSTPGINGVLKFLLTNSGNGQEAFSLARTNGPTPLPSGNYTPTNGSVGSLYLENGLQAGFQASGPNADTVYSLGVNDPDLAPGAGQIVYVISDTPNNIAVNAHGEVLLAATSLTAGAPATPGTSTAGLVGCAASCAAVFATAHGQASATGSYIASGLSVVVDKTVASALDPHGTAVIMPGTVVTYQILVTLSGAGTATNLVIADPLPADTTYVPGSITVNSIAKTDAADADNAQFSANTVSVSLGNVAAPANVVIMFRATIN